MTLELSDIYDLASGYRDPIIVGILPDDIRTSLGLKVGNVYLSRESFDHIMERHSPDYFELLLCPIMIEQGLLSKENNKNVITANYFHADTKRRYCAIMKIIARDCEIWMSSFHRLKNRQTRSILRRGQVIRPHK